MVTMEALDHALQLVNGLDRWAHSAARKVLFSELISCVLKRSDSVIANHPYLHVPLPAIASKNGAVESQSNIVVKSLSSLPVDCSECKFLKMYYFFCATQERSFCCPENFSLQDYIHRRTSYENFFTSRTFMYENFTDNVVEVTEDLDFPGALKYLLGKAIFLENEIAKFEKNK